MLWVGAAGNLTGFVEQPLARARDRIRFLGSLVRILVSISRRFEGITTEQKALLADVVSVDPERLSGTPCFKGTRVPIQALIDHIEGNSTLEDFLEGFPSVTREQAIHFIELAKDNLLAC
jgi:uncharacterized protein (DUF433 family)